MKKQILVFMAVCVFYAGDLGAFEERKTHTKLTQVAVEYDGFLNKYFKNELMFNFNEITFKLSEINDGIQPIEYERFKYLNENSIYKHIDYIPIDLIRAGAHAEDYPNLPFRGNDVFERDPLYFKFGSRASHHFHDPVNETRPGLSNQERLTSGATRLMTQDLNALSGISAGNRALDFDPPAFCCESVRSVIPPNFFDWRDARRYYYRALTSASDAERSHYWALLFLSLGHIMHLVEDMAVPSHVRNDMSQDHLYSLTNYGLNNFEDYVLARKTRYIGGLDGSVIPKPAEVDIQSYWDGNGMPPLGLSEYTQKGFLSLGTIFRGYEYPHSGNGEIYMEWSGISPAIYMRGRTAAGEAIDHLARVTLKQVMLSYFKGRMLEGLGEYMGLDERCYEDYARLLLPRAAAYASGVLKSFFRGTMEVRYLIDGRVAIKNTGREEMAGTFTLYREETNGARLPVEAGSWSLAVPPGEEVWAPGRVVVRPGTSGARPMVMVFKGRLGRESEAVAARAFYAPNAARVWRVTYYNDWMEAVDRAEVSGEQCEEQCCEMLWSGRYLFNYAGDTVHYAVAAFYHDPLVADLLPTGDKDMGYCYDMAPWYGFTAIGGIIAEYSDAGRCGFSCPPEQIEYAPWYLSSPAWLSWLCPGSKPSFYPSYRDYSEYPGLKELVDQAPRPRSYAGDLEVVSRSDLVDILHGLHQRLYLPADMDIAGATYALLQVPLPAPEIFDYQWTGKLWSADQCPNTAGTGSFFIPEGWSLLGAMFYDGTGAALKFRRDIDGYVYGPDYDYLYEKVRTGLNYRNHCRYNPEDPFQSVCDP